MLTCMVIPHYDHVEQFSRALPALLACGVPLIVVDDASPAEQYEALERLLAQHADQVSVVRHGQNQGKGGAVMTGLRTGHERGFSHAVQVDADGQHDVQAISRLLEQAEQHPGHLICGQPVFGDDISRLRFYARYLTLFLCWLETLSKEIRDAMCGLRVYPLTPIMQILDDSRPGKRMDFDPEILVRAVWAGIPLNYVPVRVSYPEHGRSHFHYLQDNLLITWMHTRMVAGMLIRMPKLLHRKFARTENE